MALTEEEKVQVRRHLGFLNVGEAFTFVLGTPAGVETQFILEGAVRRILVSAEPMVRGFLCELAELEKAKHEVALNAVTGKIGNIELRDPKAALAALDNQIAYKRGDLANAFGIYVNPFDKRGGGGINVRVA